MSSIPLRNQDIDNITKAMKSWMLQDQFNRKISDQIMYRLTEDGGFGLYHVKSRAESHLLRSFLETAGHPNFRHSDINVALLKQRGFGEDGQRVIPGPYYNKAFFNMIDHLKKQSGAENICLLSLKEIYKIRLDANVLTDLNGIKMSSN